MRHSWLLLVLISMAPLWLFSALGRGYWTPDEPREADLAWHMSQSGKAQRTDGSQGDWVLPELGAHQFLEKPPLSYWLSAASFRVFGQSPAAARVPNLLYVVMATVAVGLLVRAMAGPATGMLAAMLFTSMFESLRVAVWLAPDACLLAGCAVALLGLYRGYNATDDKHRLWWYTLMHVGALWGFMAKSAVGWLVPGLTLLTLIAWERRWRELQRWQLWAGLSLQITVIGAWVAAVLQRPDGMDDLRVLFWNNLAGRFTHVNANTALDYAAAHQNWAGKYLIELPYYVFPWVLLLLAAVRRAWSVTQTQVGSQANMTAWRFAIASWLPFAVLISMAATARDIYFAPALPGISVLVALWVHQFASQADRFDQWMLRGTRYLVGLLMLLIAAMMVLLSMTELKSDGQLAWIALSITVLVAMSLVIFKRAATAQRQQQYAISVAWCYMATIITLTIAMLTVTPVINRWQDLGKIASAVGRDVTNQPLAALQPDETTIAMLDYHAGLSVTELQSPTLTAPQLVAAWFNQHSSQAYVLVLLPGHALGAVSQWLERFKPQPRPGDGIVTDLVNAKAARIVARYELPQGRRYALLASPTNITDTSEKGAHE